MNRASWFPVCAPRARAPTITRACCHRARRSPRGATTSSWAGASPMRTSPLGPRSGEGPGTQADGEARHLGLTPRPGTRCEAAQRAARRIRQEVGTPPTPERTGRLFVISGPSGVGKGSVVKALLERDPSLYFSVSAKTRAPRRGEVEGVDYRFMSEAEFDRLVS